MRRFLIVLVLLTSTAAAFAQSAPDKMKRARALLSSGGDEEAHALLLEIVEEYPRYGPARLQLGRTYLEGGDLDLAEEHLLAATRSSLPRVFLAWHFLGRVYLAKGDHERAGESFREAIGLAPDFTPARLFLIEVAERSGDRWAALAGYREVLERAPSLPERPELEARMANLTRTMGAYELAECTVRQAIEGRPEDGSLHHLLAVILQDAGRADEALVACQKAIDLGFREAPVYVTLGDLYHDKMLLSESIAALGKAIELDPEAAETIASFALSSLTTEDYAALRELLERHVQAHPDNLNTLYSLAVMHLRENELDEAKRLFLRLETLLPRRAQVHYNLALIYSREGRKGEASFAMDRFRELKAAESEEWHRQNHANARRLEAREAHARGEVESAIQIYLALAKEGVAETSDFIALGNLYLEAGDYQMGGTDHQMGGTWFEKALEAEPYNKEGLRGLAEATFGDEVSLRSRRRLELLESPCPE